MLVDDNLNIVTPLVATPDIEGQKTTTEEITTVSPDFVEIGYVTAVTDGIAYVHGLGDVFAGEVVRFNNSTLGLVVNLEENTTGITIFGNDRDIKQGDHVVRLHTVLEIPTGPFLLGRTLDALGNFIDSITEVEEVEEVEEVDTINEVEFRAIEMKAPGIISRVSINEPLLTGIIAIDSMIPIGRGQRELIIGDRQTGKTAIALDTIVNQHSNTFYI
jgi:F0F1-type ATP synthase alpha subunit